MKSRFPEQSNCLANIQRIYQHFSSKNTAIKLNLFPFVLI